MLIRAAYQQRRKVDLNDEKAIIEHLTQLYVVEGATPAQRDKEVAKFCIMLKQFGYGQPQITGFVNKAIWTSQFSHQALAKAAAAYKRKRAATLPKTKRTLWGVDLD